MSYINFLGQGANSPYLKEYHRSNFSEDEVESVGTLNKFNGEIKVVDTDKTDRNDGKSVLMDEAVRITTIADAVRNKGKSFWSDAHNAAMITFTATLIGGIAGITAAIIVGALLPTLWPVALAVGLVSLGILGFSFFNLYRAKEAKGQIKQWDDPIPHLQQQRRKAGESGNEGFHYSYMAQLKDKIVSPEELKALWYRGMDYFVDRFGPESVAYAANIREFMERAPIEDCPFTYTFGPVPEDDEDLFSSFYEIGGPASSEASSELRFLSKLSGQFASLKIQYGRIRSETEGNKASICLERSSRIAANDAQRDANLAPIRRYYNLRTASLRRGVVTLQEEISRARSQIAEFERRGSRPARVHHRGHVPVGTREMLGLEIARMSRRQISLLEPLRLETEAKLSRLELMYMAMTAPIRELHSRNETNIRCWASGELQKIQAGEDLTLLQFHQPIKELLSKYAHRNDRPGEVDSAGYPEIDVNPVPSAPPLEEEFELPEYNPEWSEIVGQVDWDKLTVTQTTTTRQYG
ncbi:MAG: hypothetical protein K940chlam7_01467 [Chlamydiae bacterium]|nr:hypothetical protein [Chlamydiota bacterium]